MNSRHPRSLAVIAVSLLLPALTAACGDDAAGVVDAGSDAGFDGVSDAESDGSADSGDATTDGGATDAETDGPRPIGRDTDDDGLDDGIEGTDDADGDGLPNFRDTDSDDDGIPDGVEGAEDPDVDGLPSFVDDDADGDGVPDGVEGTGDADGDRVPDFLDNDADNDGLTDRFEGNEDPDDDGIPNSRDTDSDGDGLDDVYEGDTEADFDDIPNFLDPDSDDDGWTDGEEYGQPPGMGFVPLDTDNDLNPDFVDVDSDGDGLRDETELGCPDSTERTNPNSDDDASPDLVEVAFVPDDGAIHPGCDPERDATSVVDFYFELPYQKGADTDELVFAPEVQRADVFINVDQTGSMGDERDRLVTSLSSIIIPAIGASLDDAAYGVGQFDDFPCSGYGSGTDRPFFLRQRITTDPVRAQAGVASLVLHSGGDYWESGFESLYQLASGTGRGNRSGCAVDVPETGWLVPPFDPAAGFIRGVADGEIGGAGFREGALPIVVHVTDAPSHAKATAGFPYGATRVETFAALDAIGAKVIGVASGTDARTDLEQLTTEAGSRVPVCAWDGPTRPAGCAADRCCTGLGGTGRAPDADGLCPLVYDIVGGGTGIDASIVAGIEAIVGYGEFEVTVVVRPDEEELAESGIDTTCFIRGVTAVRGTGPENGCADTPIAFDSDSDGELDSFSDVAPGSTISFKVDARNDCVQSEVNPRVFTVYLDVIGRGGAVLDRQIVTVLVPPSL